MVPKSGFNLAFAAGVQDIDLDPASAPGGHRIAHLGRCQRKVWIDEQRNGGDVGYELANKVQPLRPHLHKHICYACDIGARPVETSNKSRLNRVATDGEHDRYRGGRRLGCQW